MQKSLSSLVAAIALSVSMTAPAFADDAATMAKNTAMFPVKALAIGAGTVVGIPVAITRRASSRSIEYTQSFADQIGGHEHIIPSFFAMTMGVPFGCLVGTGEGVFYGGRNAIVHGSEKPFGLASFSLESELTD